MEQTTNIIIFNDDDAPFERRVLHGIRHIIEQNDALHEMFIRTRAQEKLMTAALDALKAKVAEAQTAVEANTTVTGSASALLDQLAALIRDNVDTPEALLALADQLDSANTTEAGNNAALAAAVEKNTPTPPAGGGTTEPAHTTAEFQPLYTVDGNVNTDPTAWVPTTWQTPAGADLFVYTGDDAVPGTTANGDGLGGEWHLYTGDLKSTI